MAEPPIARPLTPPSPPPTSLPLHTPPPPFTSSSLTPITQGAEALVYKTTFLSPQTPVVLKYRPPKPYRHPTLDARLTKQRLLAEARSLARVKRGGVNVPGVLGLDWEKGWIVLEFVGGGTVRGVLDAWASRKTSTTYTGTEEGKEEEEKDMLELMRRVGREIGKLHALGVCHGDLTTSNIMLRSPVVSTSTSSDAAAAAATDKDEDDKLAQSLQGDVFLIDFGLTSASIADEDKAVDLYVLERAFSATHPAAEPLFHEVLRAYGETGKGARGVLKRLEEVRLRGRKRSMLG
ncbi:EKC/KEOPS complex subunit bud32 [Curvularia clavata]|uniref:EKC/KEOPS complex subunit BUD32 n=1 Tax=Curvularia clavata TaxID=95742 RepID=A0A9Q8ZAF4_CURCL|nr:EKC/KEOPS complex subunit bud32 [Curvularia clavata]